MTSSSESPYLTTRELAELLRIKERKVYDMASAGDVPCVRVVGKLLFPRVEILQWLNAGHCGPQLGVALSYPNTLVGSHDPLLEWAMRESQCGIASFCDGSRDGLERMSRSEALVCGTHLHEGDDWNVGAVEAMLPDHHVVLVEFAQRSRGLILAPGGSRDVTSLKDVESLRIAHRQATAASQQLFETMLHQAGVDINQLATVSQCARTEDELGMLVFDGTADVAFGLASVAKRLQLDFVPQLQERFDLLVWRKAWFDEPFQLLWRFMQTDAFSAHAIEIGGYDIDSMGVVRYNAAVA